MAKISDTFVTQRVRQEVFNVASYLHRLGNWLNSNIYKVYKNIKITILFIFVTSGSQ